MEARRRLISDINEFLDLVTNDNDSDDDSKSDSDWKYKEEMFL